MILVLPIILMACGAGGSGYVREILAKPPAEWTPDDCMTIITHATGHNAGHAEARVRLYVTPLSPTVLTAMKKIDRLPAAIENNVLETGGIVYHPETGIFTRPDSGLTVSPGAITSVLLLVTIENKTWPYATVDIADLESRIFLENDREERISPVYVQGKHQQTLKEQENLLLLFHLQAKDGNFLGGSEEFRLALTAFDNVIKIQFPVSALE